MDDFKVIVAALEKACKLVQETSDKVAKLESRMDSLEKLVLSQTHKINEAAYTAGADADLKDWMDDTSQQPAYESALSPAELQKKLANFYDRKTRGIITGS